MKKSKDKLCEEMKEDLGFYLDTSIPNWFRELIERLLEAGWTKK